MRQFLAILLCLCWFVTAALHASAMQLQTDATLPQVELSYTGRLMGYFRWPEVQTPDLVHCPDGRPTEGNTREFLDSLTTPYRQRVLIGTGDNFSPEFLARAVQVSKGTVPFTFKDLYATQTGGWQTADNVGCFLALAGYDAIVPGKLDFYFGPDYLRYLEHTLRNMSTPGTSNGLYHPVRVLGSNLVIETRSRNAPARIPHWDRFTVRYTNDKGSLKPGIADGSVILPWTTSFNIGNFNANEQFAFLCSAKAGDPESFRVPDSVAEPEGCVRIEPQGTTADGPLFKVPGDPHADTTSFLQAGRNYALCVANVAGRDQPPNERTYCSKFSVWTPLFTNGQPTLLPGSAVDGDSLCDPAAPYVCKVVYRDADDLIGTKVAIFGAVDPDLKKHVGRLNYAWYNKDYSTELTVLDPVESLKTALAYFEADYLKRHNEHFNGIRILLAHMPHQLAEGIARRLAGTFQVIVTQAEEENATPIETRSIVVPANERDGGSPTWTPPTFVVVPKPFFNPSGGRDPLSLQVQTMKVAQPSGCAAGSSKTCAARWTFENTRNGRGLSYSSNDVLSAGPFSVAIGQTIHKQPETLNPPNDTKRQLQLLALLVMKRKLHTDVAFLQRRDFFDARLSSPPSSENLQEAMDRVFWKGDFAQKLVVSGATLKQVVEQSQQFDDEDSDPLSPFHEASRSLTMLGIMQDRYGKDIYVNGAPVVDNRLYSVATSDYVALGDTGYPQLAAPAVGHIMGPGELPTLHYIGDWLCEEVSLNSIVFAKAPCRPDTGLDPRKYFDPVEKPIPQEPFDMTSGFTPARHFLSWIRFWRSRPSAYIFDTERRIQHQDHLLITLEQFSIGYSRVFHSRSNEDVVQRLFGQVSEPNLTIAPRSRSFAGDLKGRVEYGPWFTLLESSYQHEITRQTLGGDHPELSSSEGPELVNQKRNTLAIESGARFHLFPRTKEKRSLKWLFSDRFETQPVVPTDTFDVTQPGESGAGRQLLKLSFNRTQRVALKTGPRFDNERSYGEFGYQYGWRLRSPALYTLHTPGFSGQVCDPKTGEKLKDCVDKRVKAQTFNRNSTVATQTETRIEHGLYMNFTVLMPLPWKDSLTYSINNSGVYFFNRTGDLYLDTKLFNRMTHSVIIPAFGNLSVVPKLELEWYRNKVDDNRLRYVTPAIALEYSFEKKGGISWHDSLLYKSKD